jgi:hypothetical protein
LDILRDAKHNLQVDNDLLLRNDANRDGTLHRVDSGMTREAMNSLTNDAESTRLTIDEAVDALCDLNKLLNRPDFDPSQSVLEKNSRPSAFVEYWIPSVVGSIALSRFVQGWFRYRVNIVQSFEQVSVTLRHAFMDWIVEPTVKIWKTIRHEEELHLIAGAQALSSDLNVSI